LDNKTLYIAEYEKGYDIGTVLSNDTIELIYIEDGAEETAGAYITNFNQIKKSSFSPQSFLAYFWMNNRQIAAGSPVWLLRAFFWL
jgi:hypothetical protein